MSATTTAPPVRPSAGRATVRLPAGVKWSDVWTTPAGLVRGDQELPVNANWEVVGTLYLCPTDGCPTELWVFADDDRRPCCPDHPIHLRPVNLDLRNPAAMGAARTEHRTWIGRVVEARRQQLVDAATARMVEARRAVEVAARQGAADMRGHVPSLLVSLAIPAGIASVQADLGPLAAAAVGVGLMTAGPVLAYAGTYAVRVVRQRRHDDGEGHDVATLGTGRARTNRAAAMTTAIGAVVAGGWALLAAVTGLNPATIGGTAAILTGAVLVWAVNRSHWEALWAKRRGLRDMARRRAEAALRRAQEDAERPPEAPTVAPIEDDTDPVTVGRRLAATWARIAGSDSVPPGFAMRRTRIVAEETRPVTIPGDDGGVVQIGWEYGGVCDPGALVARSGLQAPLAAAATWLASMLERDPSTVSVVDRPVDDEGNPRPNRFLIILTERAPLGAAVPWKGPRAVRHTDDAILVHTGRTLTGNDVIAPMYERGKPFGGLTVGTTGGGKSAGTVLQLLNALAAGIFPILDDPKNLVDYADFIGLFPIGVTAEHADVIIRSLIAERRRREQHLATRPMVDRHGRRRPAEPMWDLTTDGPPILAVFEEFHMRVRNPVFMTLVTEHVRAQRAAAMGLSAVTQGGGLADLNNSEFRALLTTTYLRLYRMADNLARLAGYTGDARLSGLPRIPGVCLEVSEADGTLPMRAAYVTREDVDGCLYDLLYTPDMRPLLPAPTLPAETIEVFRQHGLMDLWDLGKGPNGLARLLSDGNTANYAPTLAATATPGQMLAADVILAIVATTTCTRQAIDSSQLWSTAPGWGRPPSPSAVSRALRKLETDGLVQRSGDLITLTPTGIDRAADPVRRLLGDNNTVVEEVDEPRPS